MLRGGEVKTGLGGVRLSLLNQLQVHARACCHSIQNLSTLATTKNLLVVSPMSQSILDDETLLTMSSPLSSLPPSSPPPPSPASSTPSPLLLPLPAVDPELTDGIALPPPFRAAIVLENSEGIEDAPDEFADMLASSDPGVTPSSPVIANNNESVQDVRRRKGQKKRKRTLADQQAVRDQTLQDELRAIAEETERMQAQRDREATEAREASFRAALEELTKAGLTWGEFVQWVCKPGCGRGNLRQRGMFERENQVEEVLDLWATKNSFKGQQKVHNWAVRYLSKVVSKEADDATGSGILMSRRMVVDESFVLKFNLQGIHHALRASCPSMASLLYAFSTSKRQRKVDKKTKKTPREELAAQRRGERKDRVSSARTCSLLFCFSLLSSGSDLLCVTSWENGVRTTVISSMLWGCTCMQLGHSGRSSQCYRLSASAAAIPALLEAVIGHFT